ncbi:MAG: hypothetical protein MR274_07005 [Clostridium sp.]|nr:hypothetical protein [Clostridium sp.]MDY3828508.1 hypothetical protein [Clostridium sp.]
MDIESYYKNLNISIANLEKLGVTILITGYLLFIYSSDVEIGEIITDEEANISPADILYFGQTLVAIGYFILLVVSENRTTEDFLNILGENINARKKVTLSYMLSLIANIIRLQGFYELVNDIK